uniref:Osmoprotectant transport system permease protein n=1 Tax=Candidatus Kentrum sp. MB TaxID=2138164 RepID=A0A450XNA7_9GAMM|nr:MAG: osmoprotectant transport system permease protein [Candidatus Kentron sp. MB]VFK34385.1 MAG: osmoprotectant transport system permease protein [Candidatus Kentron sp. MB]VFK76490.1 MAG: osmoprotectant transport system permease protein [Candidatus Kentron sp. MB]
MAKILAKRFFIFLCLVLIQGPLMAEDKQTVKIGSKNHTESVILGELAAHLVKSVGETAIHRRELGGTTVVWKSLLKGDIDIYAEYTGTMTRELFVDHGLKTLEDIRAFLRRLNISMTDPLGFNNTYAISMKRTVAEKYGIRKISDLRNHPSLRLGFSESFMARNDGWQSLRKTYQLPQTDVRGIQHNLSYQGLDSGAIDVIDAYATDGEIAHYDLLVLEDDLQHFPLYLSLFLYRDDLQARAPQVVEALRQLEGRISDADMTKMNAKARLEKIPGEQVTASFLSKELHTTFAVSKETLFQKLARLTIEHLVLVIISLLSAIAISIPLGILAFKYKKSGQIILGVTGIIQTIPSLAILVFMIPLLGIGNAPAIMALFLYSLLPIVRNTYVGLAEIPPQLKESAQALGLPPLARLRLIELPLAARPILAGIKTSAILNIGTATLGALIGAGGYGQPILTGIRLDNINLILQGAIPAAILALLAQGIFELAERWIVPKGLRMESR